MKQKIPFLLIVVISAGLLSGALFKIDNIKKGKLLSQVIYQSLEILHYSKKKINNDFSEKGLKEYLKNLDYNKRFFLKSDINKFDIYKDKIDDELAKGSTKLLKFVTQRLQQRIHQVIKLLPEILEKPFDFTKEEFIEFDRDKREYCSNLSELKEYWRKILKNQTMIRYISLLRVNDKKKIEKDLQKEAQEAVLKSFRSIFKRMLQTNKKDALFTYFKSILKVFDPHTAYLSPIDKENFDLEMSGSFQGIGALLTEEEDYIKVVRIISGGPSWHQKQLQPNDFILKVAQGDKEPVDIIGMRTIDAVKLIRGKKGTLVKLTVKKPDGRIVIIPIVRDVVIIEETFARSAIILNEKLGKICGYISLPRFYNDFTNKNGHNSADDIKKELKRLKLKKVDGIILDLRNNSGGSLRDAIQISGLFIPKGPIVQTKDRKLGIKIFNDPDSGISYNGPLVVLINSLSASATEILAAALQDYGRAVIVGGSHTYGKGTVQILVNLDKYLLKNYPKLQPFGALKITIQKFYRITGSSNQYKGIIPDIILPDHFDYLKIGEKYLEHSLKWDSIPPAPYKKWEPHLLKLKMLSLKSKSRIEKKPYFRQLQEYIQKIKKTREITEMSLNLKKVMKEQKELREQIEKLNKSQVELSDLKVFSSQKIKKKYSEQLSKIAEDRQKNWFKQLKKDLFLNEAIAILNDITEI